MRTTGMPGTGPDRLEGIRAAAATPIQHRFLVEFSPALNSRHDRHTLAAHLLEGGYDMQTLQGFLGHCDVKTTMIDTHVLSKGGPGVRSPQDGP